MSVHLGDILEVACVHVFDDIEEQVNVWHVRTTSVGTFDDADADGDLDSAFGQLYSLVDGAVSSRVNALEIRWRNITTDGATRFIPWGAGYVGGTGSSDALPPGASLLMLLRTGVKGIQGKKYWPTLTESNQDAGVWTSGTIGAFADVQAEMGTGFMGGVTSAEYEYVVYSRTTGLAYDIISTSVRPIVAYQRRRRQGRGS